MAKFRTFWGIVRIRGVTSQFRIANNGATMKPFEGPLHTRSRPIAHLSGIGRRWLCSGQDFRYRPAVAGVDPREYKNWRFKLGDVISEEFDLISGHQSDPKGDVT